MGIERRREEQIIRREGRARLNGLGALAFKN